MKYDLVKKILSPALALVACVSCFLYVSNLKKAKAAVTYYNPGELTMDVNYGYCSVSYTDYVHSSGEVYKYKPEVNLVLNRAGYGLFNWSNTSNYRVEETANDGTKVETASVTSTYYLFCKADTLQQYESLKTAKNRGTSFSALNFSGVSAEVIGSNDRYELQENSARVRFSSDSDLGITGYNDDVYYFAIAVKQYDYYVFDNGFLHSRVDAGHVGYVDSLNSNYDKTLTNYEVIAVSGNYYCCNPYNEAYKNVRDRGATASEYDLKAWWTALGYRDISSSDVNELSIVSREYNVTTNSFEEKYILLEVNKLRCFSKDYVLSVIAEKGYRLSDFDVKVPEKLYHLHKDSFYIDNNGYTYAKAISYTFEYGFGLHGLPHSLSLFVDYNFYASEQLAKIDYKFTNAEETESDFSCLYVHFDNPRAMTSGVYKAELDLSVLTKYFADMNYDVVVSDSTFKVKGNVTSLISDGKLIIKSDSMNDLMLCAISADLVATPKVEDEAESPIIDESGNTSDVENGEKKSIDVKKVLGIGGGCLILIVAAVVVGVVIKKRRSVL